MVAKKYAVVTGCSEGGLGAELARSLADRGYHVFATVRTPSKAASLACPSIELLSLEVSSPESIAALVAEVKTRTGGRLDVLVNNAGAGYFIPLLHASIDESRWLFDINVWGVLAVAQAFAPLLIASKGAMMNICSIAGAARCAWQGIYNASKAAEVWVSETLRIEIEPLGVRVVTAMVGEVETKIYSNMKPFTLPADSPYKAIEDILAQIAQGKLQNNNEDPKVTARNLTADLVHGKSGQVWRGGVAGFAKYATWLLPTRVFERILHNDRGVYKLKPPSMAQVK